VIAGEDSSLTDQRKAEMVWRVTWRVQHIERNAARLHHVSVPKRPVWPEGWIDESFTETRRAGAALGTGRAEAHELSAEQRLQGARAVAMVAMAVGDQDVGDALATCGLGDRNKMLLVGRTGVDDRHATAAYEISVGAEEGVWARIVGDDAAHLRRDLLGNAVVDINTSIEGKLCRHGVSN